MTSPWLGTPYFGINVDTGWDGYGPMPDLSSQVRYFDEWKRKKETSSFKNGTDGVVTSSGIS